MSKVMRQAASASVFNRNYDSTELSKPQTESLLESSTLPDWTCELVKHIVLTGDFNYEELKEIATAARTKAHGLKREAIERENSDKPNIKDKNSNTQVTRTILTIRRGNEVISLIFKGYTTTGEEKRYWSNKETSTSFGPDTEETRKLLGVTDYPTLPPPLKIPVRGKYKIKSRAASVNPS